MEDGFDSIGDDVLQEILSRLPAKSFAYAACVCSSWSRVCARILSRPKLLSALSLNTCIVDAVDEAMDKILAEPIRPHFAIAFIREELNLWAIHNRVVKRLGSGITILISETPGIIGPDALTDEFREVKWVECDAHPYNSSSDIHSGLVLMVGFVPGLRVCAVPFSNLHLEEPPLESAMDQFVTDIKDFTASVSGCSSPIGIIMFMDQRVDAKLVLDKLDYAMSKDTAIIGDDGSQSVVYSNGAAKEKEQKYQLRGGLVVALVFAKEKESSHGEIQFSVALSTGISPVGPVYERVRVFEAYRVFEANGPEWNITLTARREGSVEEIGGQRMIQDLDNEVENDISSDELYTGVVRQRKRSIGSEKVKWTSSLAFHKVNKAGEKYLFVKGDGIKTGDQFQFYRPDPESALLSRNSVVEDFKALKQSGYSKRGIVKSGSGNSAAEVFGGLVFSCFGRGESFFGRPNVDSSALTENFPGLPIGGMFCSSVIGRSTVAIQGTPVTCFRHVYSTVYLLMLYLPKKL